MLDDDVFINVDHGYEVRVGAPPMPQQCQRVRQRLRTGL
jgi:hypothetical protein